MKEHPPSPTCHNRTNQDAFLRFLRFGLHRLHVLHRWRASVALGRVGVTWCHRGPSLQFKVFVAEDATETEKVDESCPQISRVPVCSGMFRYVPVLNKSLFQSGQKCGLLGEHVHAGPGFHVSLQNDLRLQHILFVLHCIAAMCITFYTLSTILTILYIGNVLGYIHCREPFVRLCELLIGQCQASLAAAQVDQDQ